MWRRRELELRIILSEDRKTLTYILHAPVSGEYNFRPVGQVTLENDPLNVMQPSFDKLNTWAKRSAGRGRRQACPVIRPKPSKPSVRLSGSARICTSSVPRHALQDRDLSGDS